MLFETERLYLRKITPDDFDDWRKILSDAETMKHYPAPYDDAGVRRWVDWTLNNYEKYGFGLWAIILKETGEFIGDCGITMQSINGRMLPEIGYHLNKSFWRKGYASEAARKCTEYAFEVLHFPAVYSYMTSANIATRGVAVRNGMKFIEEYEDGAHGSTFVYAITYDEWKNASRA